MALINCKECNAEISDKAPHCVRCGAPVTTEHEIKAAGAKLSTTQLTSKKLKMHSLLSLLFFITGLFTFFIAGADGNPSAGTSLYAVLATFGGFTWYLITRIRIWWHHG